MWSWYDITIRTTEGAFDKLPWALTLEEAQGKAPPWRHKAMLSLIDVVYDVDL
jgi:hypothetical protein